MPEITDSGARNFVIDEIIYQEAEKLQSEFRTLYYSSGSLAIIPSSIYHETLDSLFTELQRPREETLLDIAIKGFRTGFGVGFNTAVSEMAWEHLYVIDTNHADLWKKDPWERGQIIDEAAGNNLGQFFPTVDRLVEGKVIVVRVMILLQLKPIKRLRGGLIS